MKHVRSHPACFRGFTLVELMMVLIIVGVMVAGAINMLSGSRFERIDSAIHLVRADMEYARAASLSNPTDPVVLRIAADGSGYHLARLSTVGTPIVGPMGPLTTTFGIGRADGAAGVRLGTVSGAVNVQFGPFGGVADPVPTLRFTLLDSDDSATVLLDPFTGDPTVMFESP